MQITKYRMGKEWQKTLLQFLFVALIIRFDKFNVKWVMGFFHCMAINPRDKSYLISEKTGAR